MDNAPAVVEHRIYQLMDAMDDDIIKAELENRIVKTWVYSYRGSDGKQVEGLSKVGVDACCTEMAKTGHVIREGDIKFSPDPTNKEYVLFTGQATRHVLDGEKHIEMEVVNGTKRQWIKMKLRSGNIVDDPFWFEKGAMKALRNARSRLIPEEIRTKIIAFAREQNRVKEVKENGQPESAPKTQSQDGTELASENQRKAIFAISKKHEYSDEDRAKLCRMVSKDRTESTKELTKDEASAAIEFLNKQDS